MLDTILFYAIVVSGVIFISSFMWMSYFKPCMRRCDDSVVCKLITLALGWAVGTLVMTSFLVFLGAGTRWWG